MKLEKIVESNANEGVMRKAPLFHAGGSVNWKKIIECNSAFFNAFFVLSEFSAVGLLVLKLVSFKNKF